MNHLRLKNITAGKKSKIIETTSGCFALGIYDISNSYNRKFSLYDSTKQLYLDPIYKTNQFTSESYESNYDFDSEFTEEQFVEVKNPYQDIKSVSQNKNQTALTLINTTVSGILFRADETSDWFQDNNVLAKYSSNLTNSLSDFCNLSAIYTVVSGFNFNYLQFMPLDQQYYNLDKGVNYASAMKCKNFYNWNYNVTTDEDSLSSVSAEYLELSSGFFTDKFSTQYQYYPKFCSINSDSTILVAGQINNLGIGKVSVYKNLSGSYILSQTLSAQNEFAGMQFGYTTAIDGDGDKICCGMYNESCYSSAFVFLYDQMTSAYSFSQILCSNENNGNSVGSQFDRFGSSICFTKNGNKLFIGNAGDLKYNYSKDFGRISVYEFDQNTRLYNFVESISACSSQLFDPVSGFSVSGYISPTRIDCSASGETIITNMIAEYKDYSVSAVTKITNVSYPQDICYCPTNDRLYVTNTVPLSVTVIKPSNNSVDATIKVGSVPTDTPYGICYCTSNNKIYSTISGSNSVAVIDPQTNTLSGVIAVGSNPIQLAYCTTNNCIYVANFGDGTISVIDTSQNIVVATINIRGNVYGICYCQSTDKIYCNESTSAINSIDPQTNTIINSIIVGNQPYGFVYCPANDKIYILNNSANYINCLDPHTNTVVATITVGNRTYGGCYCPTNQKIYVSNMTYGGKTIACIDPYSNSVVNTLTIGSDSIGPRGICYCPSNDKIYCSYNGDNTVTVSKTDRLNKQQTAVLIFNKNGSNYKFKKEYLNDKEFIQASDLTCYNQLGQDLSISNDSNFAIFSKNNFNNDFEINTKELNLSNDYYDFQNILLKSYVRSCSINKTFNAIKFISVILGQLSDSNRYLENYRFSDYFNNFYIFESKTLLPVIDSLNDTEIINKDILLVSDDYSKILKISSIGPNSPYPASYRTFSAVDVFDITQSDNRLRKIKNTRNYSKIGSNNSEVWMSYKCNKDYIAYSFTQDGKILVVEDVSSQESSLLSKFDFVDRIKQINRYKNTGLHKSNIFSIEIIDSGMNLALENTYGSSAKLQVQKGINGVIRNIIRNIAPIHTQLWKIDWKGQ